MQPHRTCPDPRAAERGLALILGIFFTIIVLGITVSGALILKSHQTKTRTSFVTHGQSAQFAKSGLIEALGWLRKQSSQPVLDFEPRFDDTAVPPVLDTIEPEVGIVREFRITGSVWGRYEVWKDWTADPDPVRAAWRAQFQCRDVSSERSEPNGTIWHLCSVGYVFRRMDDGVAFNQQPNQVLGQEVMTVEARRLAINPPGQAALCTDNGSNTRVQTKGRILGGSRGAGIYYKNTGGVPTVTGTGAICTGTPAMAATATYDDSIGAVFGVTLDELKAMANYVVTTAAEFPSPVPTNSLIVCEVPITFTAAQPLRGTAVVVCTSNVTISPSSYSNFNGLLYVAGNFSMREPSEIAGAVIVGGSTLLQGNADSASISYDDGILNMLRIELGSYRLSSAFLRPREHRF